MVYWVGLSEREGFMDKLENFKLQLVILLACEILILGLLAILGMDFNFVLMMAGVVGFNVFLVIWVMIRYDRDKKSRDQNLARILGNDAKDALLFGEVGILVYDENLIVTWFNDFLADRGINLIGKKVSSWNPNINDLFIDKADVVTIEDGDYVYEITRKENSTVLYVKDVSDYEKLRKVSQEEKTVLGLIQLDNYDEVSQYEDESMNSQLNMKLRQPVFEWAKENGIVIRRVKSDRFYMVLNESIYQKILNEKFSILNIIRKNSEEIGVNVTLSMAIARGNKKLSELDEMLINLMELAQNRGGDQVAVKLNDSEVKYIQEKPKGIGNSVTLPEDISNIDKLEEIVLALTEQVTYRLRKQNMLARVVNVQLRNKDFVDTSHQRKLPNATASTKEIFKHAKELLEQMYRRGTAIRLIGVRVDDLTDKEEMQISLFHDEVKNEKQEKLDKTIDKLKEKYGYNFITRAGKMGVEDLIKFRKEDEK